MENHWAQTCRTTKHLVELYQKSLKNEYKTTIRSNITIKSLNCIEWKCLQRESQHVYKSQTFLPSKLSSKHKTLEHLQNGENGDFIPKFCSTASHIYLQNGEI